MRFSMWGLIFLLASPAAIATAKQQQGSIQQPAQQQQEDSLAAAARRAREHRKNEQGKKPKVWDNDNIPKTPGDVSIVGQSVPAAAAVGASAGPEPKSDESASEPPIAGNAPAQAKQRSALEAELAAAKGNLQTFQTDLDILQRKFALDQQTYYSKPDYSSDKDGATALKGEQDQIDAKQQEMSDEQKKVADLQAQLDAASADNTGTAK